jgi:hypothetical protein
MSGLPSQPHYKHPTVGAVAKVLHDRLGVEGGVSLLRRAARIRMVIAGAPREDARVALALEAEGYVATHDLTDQIIEAVRDAAYSLPD